MTSMRNVYVLADNIFSPLGKNTSANMEALGQGRSGIQEHRSGLSPEPFYAALFSPDDKNTDDSISRFEYILLASAREAMLSAGLDFRNKKTGFILSSTKGNIHLIENIPDERIPVERISLNSSADLIAGRLGIQTEPLVVSHACISGLLAMITGMRLIQSGVYDQLVISGGDLITSFIYSGFRSFQAISTKPCRPFDAARDGISLGEAAATVVLSANKKAGQFVLAGG